MDVELPGCDPGHTQIEGHGLHELLQQHRRVGAADVCAEQAVGVRVREQLAEALGVLHRPSVCGVAVGSQ